MLNVSPPVAGLLAGLAAACFASSLAAQDGSSELGGIGGINAIPTGLAVAAGVLDAPVVDGRLDEAAWGQAAPMTGFIQREPSDGQPASEPTEVRVVFDDQALYVGVWLFDSRPDEIVPGERIRDYQVEQSDNVVLIFDTYKDEQNGFVFGTTPAGIEYDGQVANEGQGGGRFGGGGGGGQRRFQSGAGGGFNKNWDGSWTVAASQDGEGWYAEFRIPFNTLRYGTDSPSWGFNVSRRIRRLNEESFWSAVPREFNLYRLNYAGDLEGLDPPFRRLATVTPRGDMDQCQGSLVLRRTTAIRSLYENDGKTEDPAVLKRNRIDRGICVGGGFRFLCIGCQIVSVGLGKGGK